MTATLELQTFRVETNDPGGTAAGDMIVRGVKVFRVGKFKDSLGRQNDWTRERLQRAVENFNLLRRNRVLPDVPVRLDHTKSIRDVVGYFHELRLQGDFLVADLQFTKQSAYNDYVNKHFRSVSLEIGQYETNDEVLYHDVVQGLAFVDLGAVEGLHQHPTGDVINMATDTSTAPATTEGTATATETTDPATPPATPAPPAPAPATPAPAEQPPAKPTASAVSEHGRPAAVQTFRVNGTEVHDHAAVQAHIDALEKVVGDTRTALRNSFVDDLAKHGKIGNPQTEPMKLHVRDLSDEQFAAFRTMYDAMPQNNLFAKHDTTTDPNVAAVTDSLSEVALARETIAQFRRMGKTDEFIKAQPQWATVQAADAAAAK